jgi:hypothetical protein
MSTQQWSGAVHSYRVGFPAKVGRYLNGELNTNLHIRRLSLATLSIRHSVIRLHNESPTLQRR